MRTDMPLRNGFVSQTQFDALLRTQNFTEDASILENTSHYAEFQQTRVWGFDFRIRRPCPTYPENSIPY